MRKNRPFKEFDMRKNRPLTVRWLKTGDMFVLKRSGEKFQYVARDIGTPSGIKHWVRKLLEREHKTLHHSCHIELI